MKLIYNYPFVTIILFFHLNLLYPQDNSLDIPIYKNSNYSIEERLVDLIDRMTLEEKLIQLGGYFKNHPEMNKELGVGSFGFMTQHLSPEKSAHEYNLSQKRQIEETRLGIPAFRSVEGIFALMRNGSTSFPQPIAQAATFDPECVAIVGEVLGKEMKSLGVSEVLSPVLNLTRDPRWGRTNETYGEDPYLIGTMGAEYVRQLESMGIQTDLKHFIANMGLNGQFGGATYFSERIMREYYFPAFKRCIDEGASSIMMAYNTFNAIPCAANSWLMLDIIKGEWGFNGFIRSDGGSAEFIFDDGGIYKTPEELAIGLMNNGCDRVSPGWFYGEPLREAVRKGFVKESRIDDAVKRFLRQKFESGIFDNPYVDASFAGEVNNNSEHRKKSLEVCKKSLVLLKNKNNTLPFSKNANNIAVVGPLADWLMVGHYGGYGRHEVTMLEGVKNLLPDANVYNEKGVEMKYFAYPAIDSNYFVGKIIAEYYDNANLSGKVKFVKRENRIEYNWGVEAPEGLPEDDFSVRWTGKIKSPITGSIKIGATVDDGVRVWINDEIVIDMWNGGSRRLAEAELNFIKDEIYEFKMEYFESGFNAFAQLGWNLDLEEDIVHAVDAAGKSDVIIAVMGAYENENWDRADLDLPEEQEELILELASLNKPMVVVLQHGSVITTHDWINEVDAVMMAWYPGCEGGNAMAQTIFGDNNPGGKLPITFPKITGQVPLNYNMLPNGKMEIKFIGDFNDPQFCFGHGLSYTEFEYSDLNLSAHSMGKTGNIDISFELKNVGNCAGDEIVQIYIRDLYASVAQPRMKLVDFKRVNLERGESKKMIFNLSHEKLKIWDINMNHVVEPGEIEIMIGKSSERITLRDKFVVTE